MAISVERSSNAQLTKVLSGVRMLKEEGGLLQKQGTPPSGEDFRWHLAQHESCCEHRLGVLIFAAEHTGSLKALNDAGDGWHW